MQSDNSEVDNEVKIGNMFSINMNKKLGSGAFGEIYRGINLKTDEEVAMKLESVKSKTPQLNYESKILKYLQGGGKLYL
jgi:casein kinase I family protein HRR25